MLQSSLLQTAPVVPVRALVTDDNATVLRFAVEALKAGMATALVTLTEIRGGAARALGAQMAVREDGLYCGFVSGGCVEAAAASEAMSVIASGQDREVKYGEGSPWFDIVLPCGGGITLSLHKLHDARPLLATLNLLEQRKSVGLRYFPHSQRLQSSASPADTGWHKGFFSILYRPRTRAIVFGRSPEAQSTFAMAQAAGYDVHLCDSYDARLPIDNYTAVLLLWHDLHRELPVLQAALAAKPFYIGALGSQRTHEKRRQWLSELGWSQEDIARIKAPIGIFPKARDASSLALSVLADVAAARLNLTPEKA
ncbi:XdhC family protein [Kalamiella sp. sgz302252]|uniref:XdhC family protein n=1 Tax=Pantoea sp. sgz302252 TaxID=3341827 RepID=UPI0036D2C83F